MLEVRDLSVYKDSSHIVTIPRLTIDQGKVLFVVGPNGSGKSTLALSCMGYPGYDITGKILIDGEEIQSISPDKRAQRGLWLSMQYIPKLDGVSVMTLFKNVYTTLVGELDIMSIRQKIEQVLVQVGLPKQTLGRSLGEDFSGGEKKRLEIAQLLLIKPQYCILDEIDAGLDIDAMNILTSAIQQLQNEGSGFMIVSHQERLSREIPVNHVIELSRGIVIREGGKEVLTSIYTEGFMKSEV